MLAETKALGSKSGRHSSSRNERCVMFPRLRSFLTTLAQRQRFEDSLDEEMRFHLDAQTEDLVRTGVPPAEAVRRARAQFGSIEAMKNACRRVRGLWIADKLRRMSRPRPSRAWRGPKSANGPGRANLWNRRRA